MIRSFSRNGLVQRSIVLPCQPRTQHRFLRYEILHPNFRRGRASGAYYRLASTSPEQPSPKSTPSSTPQLPPATPRKHKVELHPSPVKPTSIKPTSSEHPLKPSPVPLTLEPRKKQDKSSASPATVPNSILETAKQDYAEARKHGILVPPPANASRVKQLWHQAKEIFKFYLRGIKLINTHRKRVNGMEARVKAGGEPLERWEARFIETYRIDAKKLIPFLLILAIIEEIIPLVVLYAPFMLPSTCVLPSQRDRILLKQREKIELYSESMKSYFRQILDRSASTTSIPLEQLIVGPERIAMSGVLSLWTFGPSPLRLSRIRRYLQRITEDDALLLKEGMDQRLTLPELQEALDERGFVTNGLGREGMQARLRWWLTCVEKDPVSEHACSERALLIASIHSGVAEKQW